MRRARLGWLMLVLGTGCATAPDKGEGESRPVRHKNLPMNAEAAADAGAPSDAAPEEVTEHGGIRAAPVTPPANETWGGMGFQEVNEKRWLADMRVKLAERYKIDPAQLIVSPGLLKAAFVRGPEEQPSKKRRGPPPPRRFQIVVVDNQGRQQASFRPVTMKGSDEPPKDLRFLGEDRLVYEVVAPPPPEPPPVVVPPVKSSKTSKRAAPASAAKSRGAGRAPPNRTKKGGPKIAAAPPPPPPATKPAAPPTRLFVIQPLAPKARPIRCEGRSFTFAPGGEHLAFVGGTPEAGFVAVDGEPVFPRRGRSIISSPAAWSKDGHSVAFLETPSETTARLVLLAEYDNATGDTTWDLPAGASIDGARVFWAASGRLIVGKTLTHPIFSASFQKLR